MEKTVLILGNGFDLAHGLPTRYSDFLKFCDTICEIKSSIEQEGDYKFEYYNAINRKIRKRNILTDLMIAYYETLIYKEKHFHRAGYNNFLENTKYEIIDNFIKNIYCFINDNIWYKYLNKLYFTKDFKGENWIDFESEISFIIETIDKNVKNITYNWHIVDRINSENIDFPDKFKAFRKIVGDNLGNRNYNVRYVRKKLYNDLNGIINALEIYLSEFVEKFINLNRLSLIDKIMPNYIINFNYTHTYQNVYGGDVKPFHIHGEVNHEPNNMVLGIDEYWSEKERNNHTNFTIFKKFAQRIQKRVGREYFTILETLEYNKSDHIYIHFFGHSLDVTDKDILKMFLANDSFEITVYCKDTETEGEYIANIIRIIGEEELINKVNQDPPKLKFVIQQPMVPIENEEEKELSTSGAAP